MNSTIIIHSTRNIWRSSVSMLRRNGIRFSSTSDEATRAAEAARNHKPSAATIFDKIISKQLPAKILYEDEKCLAFEDVAPQAPVHFLVIPKRRLAKLDESVASDVDILGHLMVVAGQLGRDRAAKGFRVVVNNGEHGCQSVYHIHLHVLGGRQLKWPPG